MATITGGSWGYSGDPSASDKDSVRWLVGDTDVANQLVSDEEILWALTKFSNLYSAAALVCDQLASERSEGGRRKIGDLEVEAGRSGKAFESKAKKFRRLAALSATPHAGGISVDAADAYVTDSDIPAPAFRIGQFDSPEVPGQGGSLTLNSTST